MQNDKMTIEKRKELCKNLSRSMFGMYIGKDTPKDIPERSKYRSSYSGMNEFRTTFQIGTNIEYSISFLKLKDKSISEYLLPKYFKELSIIIKNIDKSLTDFLVQHKINYEKLETNVINLQLSKKKYTGLYNSESSQKIKKNYIDIDIENMLIFKLSK